MVQVYEFAPNFSILQDQPAHAHRQLEPSRSRAARIEVEDSVARLLLRHVTVATNYDRESSSFGFEIQLRQIVQDIDGDTADFENFRPRELERPGFLVDIPPHSDQRRDSRKFFENLGCAHIPRVNDML